MAEVVVGLGILVVAIGGVALLWVISEPAPDDPEASAGLPHRTDEWGGRRRSPDIPLL